jgi:hypothetical protein
LGIQPGFYDFVIDALREGWSYKTVYNKLKYPVIDVFGLGYWKEIEKRIYFMMKTTSQQSDDPDQTDGVSYNGDYAGL